MNYKSYIFIFAFLFFANLAFAKNKFCRLLPKTVTVGVQHPSSKIFSLGITNSLNKNISFKSCNFDCKCLEIISYKKNNYKVRNSIIELAPNDVLTINFKIKSKFYTKSKILPLYFHFNNIVPAVQIVKIIADIKSDIISNPESLACIIPQGFKGKIGSFDLKSNFKNLKIKNIKPNVDFIKAKYNLENNAIDIFLESSIEKNTDAWLKITYNSMFGKTNQTSICELHIRDIKIIPDIYLVPTTMDFGIISKPGTIPGKEVILKSRTETPWKIIGSQIKGRNKMAIKRKVLTQTNSTVNVLWAILDGKLIPGLIDSEIIITTDHPYSKQIVVPIKGQIINPKKM